MARVRQEFDELIKKPAIANDASAADLSIHELLDKSVNIETANDLEFATMCMQEALRYQPSAPMS